MEDYQRSRSYGPGAMQMEPYRGPPPPSYDLRSYSTSYAQSQMGNSGYPYKDFTLKKSNTASASSSKPWGVTDPEFQRKKRVASYKMYSVEGKVKGTFRKSFRWLKDRSTRVFYGWW